MSETSREPLELIDVPQRMVDLAWRRTAPLLKAEIHQHDALKRILVSCYLQGMEDGWQIGRER